jgi:hypothetical protein
MAQRTHPYLRPGSEAKDPAAKTLDPIAKTRLEISAMLGDSSFVSGSFRTDRAKQLPPHLPTAH